LTRLIDSLDRAEREYMLSILNASMLSLFVSAALTWLFCATAWRLRWVPQPVPNRLPVKPVPILGGAAIFAAFLVPLAAHRLVLHDTEASLIFLGTAAFLLGAADDLWNLRPRWKLLGQLAIALVFLNTVGAVSITGHRAVDALLVSIWIVGITNAFNLLDNINGLCGGTAALVAGFQAVSFYISGDTQLASLCFVFAAALCGFLIFNFPAGRIFMGDAGSMFIGCWLATTTLIGVQHSQRNHVATILFPLLIMIVPICDTTLVTLTRKLRRRPVSLGGTDHLSHRLVAYGFSKRNAVIALWGVTSLGGAVGILTLFYGAVSFVSAVALLVVFVAILGIYLAGYELLPESSDAPAHPLRSPKWLRIGLGLACDVILIAAAYYTAYLLRFDPSSQRQNMQLFYESVGELMLIKLAVFVGLGAYRRWWQYFGLKDAFRIGSASAIASLVAVAYFAAVYRFYDFSRIVFVLDFLAFTLLAIAFRFSFRLFDSFAPATGRANVLIYGADDDGETALHFVGKHYPFKVVGFLDEDASKRDLVIHSVPVCGGVGHLDNLVKAWNVKAVLLTSALLPSEKLTLMARCRKLGIGLLRFRFDLEDVAGTEGRFWKDFASDHDGSLVFVPRATVALPIAIEDEPRVSSASD
jgi:UDP-GlcNAc:undecaprenyl-phosphate/decaprenyl-phosphate GlcNAc-1-phosphate transferase